MTNGSIYCQRLGSSLIAAALMLAGTAASRAAAPVRTGLALELAADAGVTADEGGLVSEWADQSGSLNDVSQLDTGKQPLFVSGIISGGKTFSVLRFDGVDDVLSRTASETTPVTGLPTNLAPGGTVFVVNRTLDRDLVGGQVSLLYGKDNSNRFNTGIGNTALSTRMRSGGGGTAATSAVSAFAPDTGTFYVQAASWDGPGTDNLFLHILLPDGTLSTTNDASVSANTAFPDSLLPMQLHIGGMGTILSGAGTTFVGEIAEALIYNGQLSTQDQAAVFSYLGAKYGVTATVQPGDFDGDHDVDGADFVAWQTNFPLASGATLAQGDADGDGDVDGADFVVWQTNFPTSPAPGASPIPEPQSNFLIVVGSLIAVSSRRMRLTGPPARRALNRASRVPCLAMEKASVTHP